jgi:hypothetical protein
MSLIRLSPRVADDIPTPPTPSDPVATIIIAASIVLALLLTALLLLASPLHPVPSQVLDGLTSPTLFNAPTT